MKRMLVNLREPEESRVALMDDSRLEQIHVQREGRPTITGNVYRGRVVNIEPGIQAAFVDIGEGLKGFLHASDANAGALALSKNLEAGQQGQKNIQSLVSKNAEILVQVAKEGVGKKGPSLTCQISLPGRYLVVMPFLDKKGVSRKIEDAAERKRLKELLESLSPPEGLGFIVRTAGIDRKKTELEQDMKFLEKVWAAVLKNMSEGQGPALLYRESEFMVRTLRDFFSHEVEEVLVDTAEGAEKARDFFRLAMPKFEARVKLYEGAQPLFQKFHVEPRLAEIFDHRVALPSGGTIVIDPTEAFTAVDVNSGRFTGGGDAEETALKTNIEAAAEIGRQAALRDLGGLIVIDFIDMKQEKNRRAVEKALKEALKRDRARTSVLKMSKFCLVEMTRQRIKHALSLVQHDKCSACGGTGRVVNAESLAARIIRKVTAALARDDVTGVEVRASREPASYLQNEKRSRLAAIEASTGKFVRVQEKQGSHDEFEVSAFGEDGRNIRL